MALILVRVKIGAVNRGPFVCDQHVPLVVIKESGQRLEATRRRETVRGDIGFARAELLEQRANTAEQTAAIRRFQLSQSTATDA